VEHKVTQLLSLSALSSQEPGLPQNCVIVVVGYGMEYFSPVTRPETVSVANPAFCSMGTGVVARG